MIDAISSYSSNHAGRLKFNNTSQAQGLYKAVASDNDAFVFMHTSRDTKKSKISPLAVVGGGAAAISLITETIFSANELSKGNFALVGDIFRHALIMGVIGAVCLGLFNRDNQCLYEILIRGKNISLSKNPMPLIPWAFLSHILFQQNLLHFLCFFLWRSCRRHIYSL